MSAWKKVFIVVAAFFLLGLGTQMENFHATWADSNSPHGDMKKEGSGSKGYSHGDKKGYSHGKKSYGHGSKGGYGHGGHGRDPFRHVLNFRDKLGLSDTQVAQIQDKQMDYKKLRVQADADHKIAHIELDRLVHSSTVDESGIRAQGQAIVASKTKKIKAMIEAKIDMLKILTDDQRKKVSQMHMGR